MVILDYYNIILTLVLQNDLSIDVLYKKVDLIYNLSRSHCFIDW